MRPLDGTLVLDLTRLLPGALVTQKLANFGAEVWKVEAPGQGDYARDLPPLIDNTGAYFAFSNNGKKSIALDLKHQEGRRVFLRLVEKVDVVLEGFRPGVLARLGLGYEYLSRCNPRLIYVALTGYGQTGPYAQKAGHDINYAAVGGLLHRDSTGRPVPSRVQLADVTGANEAVVGILLALLSREKTGEGQQVDVSMLESILPMLTVPLAEYAATGSPGGMALLAGKYACYNIYQAADGRFLALGALEPKFWSAFCTAAECEVLIDEQFVEAKQPELISKLAAIFRRKTAKEWLALLQDVDTCLTPVNDVAAVLEDHHLASRGAWTVHGSDGIQMQVPGVSPRLSATPGFASGTLPKLGEHTREILSRVGVSAREIAELARLGVIDSNSG
jgi:alpha-methylacyl-CoA racemase